MPSDTTTVPAVYTAISHVSDALSHEGISKDRSNQQQGYKFRGIDDCLNAISSLLPLHGLVIIPTVLEREVVERQTKQGGNLFYVTVKVQFSFISTLDGSRHDAVLYGEAMDSADKATNKAMSAAYKYAVLLTFCIPTEGDNDADARTHEVLPTTKTFAQKFPEQAQKIQAKLTQGDGLESHASTHGTDHQKSQDAPASLLPAYLEQIAMSETVTECSKTLNMALKDESLSVFDVKQLQLEGQKKILALRAAKVPA